MLLGKKPPNLIEKKRRKSIYQSILKFPSLVGKLREKVKKLFEKIDKAKNLLTQWGIEEGKLKDAGDYLIDGC